MSLNKKVNIDSSQIEDSKDNSDNKNNDNNKIFYLKYIALKNALVAEKQKTSILERDNKSLKEQNNKNEYLN